MMDKVYILPGDPVSLLRARYSRFLNGMYNSQKTRQLVDRINIQEQHGDNPPFQGPLHFTLTFYMPIPKNISAKKRELLLGSYHVIRSDLDNLIKYVSDVCQTVLFKDDCTISKITAQKLYDANPRTEITVKVLS